MENGGNSDRLHRVVIVGGGFGGLAAAQGLAGAPVRVSVVDRRNFHLFQPLLYQVATGGLSPGDITMPIRSILKRHERTTVLLDEAVDLDAQGRRLLLKSGAALPYDTLIVASGVRHHYFDHPEWEKWAPGLKTIEEATAIRSRILRAFEAAEAAESEERRRRLLTFVVVGGGPTGVELAGAVGELARHTLRHEFRTFDPADARIVLVEAFDRVLPGYPTKLSESARRQLEVLGVEVLVDTRVEDRSPEGVRLVTDGETRDLAAEVVLWAAGVQASVLGQVLAERAGARLDRAGRVIVEPDCSIAGHPEILVIGDLAHFEDASGQMVPGVAPAAKQQGQYAARLVGRRLAGRTIGPFEYRNRGSLAVIGRASAVADLGRFRFSGYLAWLMWLFIHILFLVGFANRILVLVQWAHSYLTKGRGARVIREPGG